MMEVILENLEENPPSCPHGPCLIFERHTAKASKSGKRFYACSACRDRSLCNFFHWVDDPISDKKRKLWKKINKTFKLPFTHEECVRELETIKELPTFKRMYCNTCSLFVASDFDKHKSHDLVKNIDYEKLQQPTTIFQSLKNKKSEAQCFFSDKTVTFVTSLLKDLKFSKLLLIGVPKVHEYLCSDEGSGVGISSFLMDIDHRYMQFFPPEKFCRYNLFNDHFFDGSEDRKRFEEFLVIKDEEKIALLIDPPFGGLVDAIAHTLNKINKTWQNVNSKPDTENMPMLWFFPYFLEPRIVKNIPQLSMMDYKVDYPHSKNFKNKDGTPVRIFTNIPGSSFVLPENEGYSFCKKCKRYVSKENKHCKICHACTTKHGKTYQHCEKCKKCTKSSYVHCDVHNKCGPPREDHFKREDDCKCSGFAGEGDESGKCNKCHGYGHHKRDCTVMRKKQKTKR